MKTATISKWGNSIALRLPDAFAAALGIKAGDKVELSLENDVLQLKKVPPVSSCKSYLEDFYKMPYSEIVKLNLQDEELIDFGADVGGEVIE